MVYYNNTLCVELAPLQQLGIASLGLWKKWVRLGAEVVRPGGNGRTSLIKFDTIPSTYQQVIIEKLGTPEKQQASSFADLIKADDKAVTYYTNYMLPDGRHLEDKYIKEYTTNANVLNAIGSIYNSQAQARKALGGNMKGFWPKASDVVNNCRVQVGHTLPSSHERLYKTFKQYKADSYYALVSKKFCNDNTLKVTGDLERLLMSLYTMPNKPFAADVHTLYGLFLAGKIQLVDERTGELFIPDQFRNKKGEFITISDSTVWNVLNKPQNRAIVDAKRNNSFSFNTMHRPHHHRKAPEFSFSKISLDDRDLPRLSSEGSRVKAYYAYDVASGCVIGKAYSRTKDEELFIECLRDMFRLIENNQFGMPLEVEVENHLVNKFFDDLGMMFPYVRICNPGNSQEKHAEHLNRAKKYGTEKKMQNGIGRWWARSEAYRVDNNKVNDQFVEKVYTFDSLVADDIAAVNLFNNSLHPKQKKYPGKTRWQVLVENLNPKAPQVSKPVVYKAIGERTTTSIQRNQYVTVQYAKYALPSPHIIDRLTPNDYTVDAYWLPNSDGMVGEVYLYQNNQYLCKCERIAEYSTAKAEWTGDDAKGYTDQAKYVSSFDKKVKEGKKELAHLQIMNPEIMDEATKQEPVIVVAAKPQSENIADLLDDYDPNQYLDQSTNNL
jgi:hypothetical protein